jgi:membrane protein
MLSKVTKFLKTDIWRMRLKNYPRRKSFFLRQLRIIVLTMRRFVEHGCKYRASSLTFFSLLSTVPVIAVMFGIAKGFGLQNRVEAELLLRMKGQEEIAKRVVTFANALLENTSGGFIAGIGVAILFWSIIKVLTHIENSFNDIWGVKTPRSLARKFSDYISMILICPFLLIIAGSATVLISSQLQSVVEKLPVFGIGPVIIFLLKLLPYCALWVVFTFVFIFMPNTKVNLKSGIVGGIIAGTIFQVAQWVYINFQIGAAKYSAIYGSFAALPLFLVWLQTSWLIVLFGAELCFAHQNVETYEFEQDCVTASLSFRKLLSLVITHRVVKNFCKREPPLDAAEISHTFEIPIRLVRRTLFELVEAGVLCEVKKNDNKDSAYQPAVDADKLTASFVIESLEQTGNSDIPIEETDEMNKLGQCLNAFARDMENSPENILLKNL